MTPRETVFPAFLRWLGRAALRVTGWRIAGAWPPMPRFVVIVAPHTSNWDFPLGLAAMFALGLPIHWLGKHTIFRGPLRPLLSWLGGEPVDRSAPEGLVAVVAARFDSEPRYLLALSPEGTRRRTEGWKTGFYRIAREAGVPIVPVAFDYQRRSIDIMEPIWPGPDAAAEITRLRRLYRREMARYPDQFAEPA
jgi:1-acyl-sn-glycerol-3-phosphate acyltransferase